MAGHSKSYAPPKKTERDIWRQNKKVMTRYKVNGKESWESNGRQRWVREKEGKGKEYRKGGNKVVTKREETRKKRREKLNGGKRGKYKTNVKWKR